MSFISTAFELKKINSIEENIDLHDCITCIKYLKEYNGYNGQSIGIIRKNIPNNPEFQKDKYVLFRKDTTSGTEKYIIEKPLKEKYIRGFVSYYENYGAELMFFTARLEDITPETIENAVIKFK